MFYLLSQILVCVLVAALVGGVIGWLLRGQSAAARRATLETELRERSAAAEQAEGERQRLSEMNRSLTGQLNELTRQAAAQEARQQGLEREVASTRERMTALDQEMRAARERVSLLQAELASRVEKLQRLGRELEAAEAAGPTARAKTKAPTPRAGPPLERPAWTLSAPEGEADDLKRIRGIGPKLSSLLNDLGIYHFRQIGRFTPADIEWVGSHLKAFRGRITRDRWVEQARRLHFEKYGERLQS